MMFEMSVHTQFDERPVVVYGSFVILLLKAIVKYVQFILNQSGIATEMFSL